MTSSATSTPDTHHVAIMGAGSWGTTFAQVIADAGTPVTLWARKDSVAHEINTHSINTTYLGDIPLNPLISATPNPAHALTDAAVVVLAIPAQTLRTNLSQWRELLPPDCVLVSLMKGIEVGTGLRMSEVIAHVADVPAARVAVVSGPNLAREIALGQPTATVIASTSATTAESIAELCAGSYFRPYTNTDVVGVELGGAIKNVIALAVGMADGQGLGDNSKASIITRGLAETTRLSVAMGAQQHTLAGLAGLGDLVATCASPLSRNRSFGRLLGEGKTVEEAASLLTQTAEGVKTAAAVLALGDAHGVELPITQAVAATLDGSLSVGDLSTLLLARKLKDEAHGHTR